MIVLDVNKLSKNFGFSSVFEGLSFTLYEGDRLAIVGQNGTGKTTLLNIISGDESADFGTVSLNKNTKIGYLKQAFPDKLDERQVIDVIKNAFADLILEENNIEKLRAEMANILDPIILEKTIIKYSKKIEEFALKGGYDMETNLNIVIKGLNIPEEMLNRSYASLSGGEKTIIHLAKILLSNPDLLLLDEPTNHLDIARIEWLEGYLQKYKGTAIIVSHDRYFLDKISKKVFELASAKGTLYFGNYSNYIEKRDEGEIKIFADFKNQQKEIKALEEAIRKNRDWGERGDNPLFFRRAKAMEKRLEAIKGSPIQKPVSQKPLPVNFVSNDRSGKIVFDVSNLNLYMGEKELLNNSDLGIFYQDKIALIGNNGTGKTSFIKLLLGEDLRYNGTIKKGSNLKIGYLKQLLEFENEKETVLDCLKNNSFLNEEEARRVLAKFQFYKEDIMKTVCVLSGGEKIRLTLAILLQKELNTLVFDEPTNHIDILTREVLEETLKSFKGTVIFVSHDRYFINSVATRIAEFENKKINVYNGNYEYYVKSKQKEGN